MKASNAGYVGSGFQVRSRRPNSGPRTLTAAFSAMLLVLGVMVVLPAATASAAAAACTGNEIVCENQLPGTDPSVWDIQGAGDSSIQGFATQTSVNLGDAIQFKIKTDASSYTIEIFRLGYYQGKGARKVADVAPSAPLPQSQPACATDPATEIYDCGTWGVSASWMVPSTAVSGVYIALLVRPDTGEASHIPFVVRNDGSHSDVVFQTSDTTWQAYNTYGQSDFYQGLSNGRAYKISFNRPYATRGDNEGRDFLFSNEYPMIRFLERNGYDLSYISGLDADVRGSLLTNHKAFLSVGHDEYWSAGQRSNVEAARDAGVNLAFFSGNEMYWKTRWEASQDGTNTPNRTLVCYKDTWANTQLDPVAPTSTWRDPRFGDNGHGPENALTGTAYMSNFTDLAITVSAAEGKNRIWRNSGLENLPDGANVSLAPHTVGYESNEDLDNGYRPEGLIRLSTTTGPTPQYLRDYGNTVTPGTTTHHLTMYKASSGALVFSAGTVQWAWGLETYHDGTVSPVDTRMQQATVNILADMSASATSLSSPGVVASIKSSDTVAPTAVISSPAVGVLVQGSEVTVAGSASDSGGGQVAGVEVSLDGGHTWHPAEGRTSFTYTGVVRGSGTSVVQARAIDDSGNIQSSPAVLGGSIDCPCSIFGSEVPATVDSGDGSPVTLGVRFSSSAAGFVTGVRFYKAAANTGSHTGTLFGPDGSALSTVTFTNESASGWQAAYFATAVPIQANVVYTVSYRAPNGHYSAGNGYFAYKGVTSGPLTALGGYANPNGVYTVGSGVPASSFEQTNYFVDPIYSYTDLTPLSVVATSPINNAGSIPSTSPITVTFSRDPVQSSISISVVDSQGQAIAGNVSYDSGSRTASFAAASGLPRAETLSVSANATAPDVGAMAPVSWSFRTAAADGESGVCPCGLFQESDVPPVTAADDPNSVELGVTFRSDVSGEVTGIRFYKGVGNDGPHSISLWTEFGQQLATATASGESISGWQTAYFASPVSINPDVFYIASYRAPVGRYSYSIGGLASPIDRAPLHTPAGAGRYTYGSGSPANASSANYFVDPVFTVGAESVPTVVTLTPTDQSTSVPVTSSVVATFSAAVQPGTAVIAVSDAAGNQVPGVTSNMALGAPIEFTPSVPLVAATAYSVTVSGAKNLGGTPMAGPYTSGFTTAGATACPCSLLPSGAVPAVSDSGDNGAVSLGLRFQAETDGYITGLRFYRDSANGGTHTGALYTESGSVLGRLTYPAADPGWQYASFASAIPVTAGDVYVASTFMPSGRYSFTSNFFASSYVNSPLTGLMGLYTYGGDLFPNQSYNNGNYYVDVTFTTQDPSTASAPAAPTNVSAAAGNGSATVTWTAPSNGGSPISGYTVTPSDGTTALTPTSVSGSNPATTAVVGGLSNGTAYTFTVTATNAKGTSSPSSPSTAVTPAPTTPGAPSAVTATPGDGQATVSWTAPVSDGGSVVTGYTVTPYIGTAAQPTTPATGTSATVNGLTNGTAYTFTVTASNAVGSGGPSAASTAVTPAGLPAAPSGVVATATNGAATVTWTAPANTGGVALTGYVVTPFIGGTAQPAVTVSGTPPATSTTINGLTNGTAYTFTVTAANAVGQGVASAASSAVTPATVPDAPTAVTAVAGNTQATVSWTVPASNGGSAITGYTVTPYAGATAGAPKTVTGTGTSTIVTGLSNNTSYTFVVAATNGVGTGAASAASAAVTPVPPTVPGAPTNVAGTPGNTQVALTWTAPSDGGAQITRYTVTPYIGTTAQTTRVVQVNGTPAATGATVTGLTNGTAYTFRVTATNSVGTSTTFGVSAAITPATTPGAPTIGSMTANDASVTVRWTAPSSTGGSAITGYVVTPYIGTAAQTAVNVAATATSTNVTGLINGTAYTFRVAAVNAMGTGAQSAASAATTPFGVPGAPTVVAGVPGNQSAYVTWSAPASNGGSAITGYTVTRYVNGVSQGTTSAGTSTSVTVNSLVNGTTYTFTVTATNARGTSAASTASAGVKPLALFVQGVAARATGATTVTATPSSNLTAGNRLIAMVGVEGTATTTAQSVMDAAGNTYTKVTSFRASDNTEMSIWTAPITAGGSRPVVTARSSASATMAITVTEYAGLSTAAGTGAVDVFKTAAGSAFNSGTAASGATTGTTGVGEVAIGFYLDGGPSRSVTTPSGYTSRVSGVNNSTMEYVIADQTIWPTGTTANAQFGISQLLTTMPWLAATVVFKRG